MITINKHTDEISDFAVEQLFRAIATVIQEAKHPNLGHQREGEALLELAGEKTQGIIDSLNNIYFY